MCEFDSRCDGAEGLVSNALALIADGRWAVTGVYGDELRPPIAYTTGLTEFGCPELALTGVDPDLAGRVLNTIAHEIVDYPSVAAGMLIDGLPCEPGEFLTVEVIDTSSLRLTTILYGRSFRALQLVWPDLAGHYPWQEHFRRRDRQPVLGVPINGTAA